MHPTWLPSESWLGEEGTFVLCSFWMVSALVRAGEIDRAEAGCEVVGPVGTLEAAIALAHAEVLDVAVLDVNLDGEKVYPAAEELQARGIPFILATGYGASTLPEKWRHRPRLSKPYRREQLEQFLRGVAGR